MNKNDRTYCGIFWMKQDERGMFYPVALKQECDADGEIKGNVTPIAAIEFSHENVWVSEGLGEQEESCGVPYDYYPRGRVEIRGGIARVYYSPELCRPDAEQRIIEEFGISGLEVIFIADGGEYGKTSASILTKKCTMCGKIFDETDIKEDNSIEKNIGSGSLYGKSRLEFQLCCNCFDRVLEAVLPWFKTNPIKEFKASKSE